MRSAALSQVPYQPKFSLSMKDPPAMDNGRGQSGIPVVTALEKIKVLAGDPLVDVDPWRVLPREGTGALSLVASINLQSIMGTRATQASPLAGVSYILERSRIDHEIASPANQGNTKSVRVRVSSIARAQRTGIDQQLLPCSFIRHQVESALL